MTMQLGGLCLREEVGLSSLEGSTPEAQQGCRRRDLSCRAAAASS